MQIDIVAMVQTMRRVNLKLQINELILQINAFYRTSLGNLRVYIIAKTIDILNPSFGGARGGRVYISTF